MSTCPHCNGDGEEPGAPISETETATCSACHGTGSTTAQHTQFTLAADSKTGELLTFDSGAYKVYIGGTCFALVYGPACDARLIAAAPDLLEALQRAEKQLAIAYNPSESPILELCRSEAQQSCNQARAAIAKAKGQP